MKLTTSITKIHMVSTKSKRTSGQACECFRLTRKLDLFSHQKETASALSLVFLTCQREEGIPKRRDCVYSPASMRGHPSQTLPSKVKLNDREQEEVKYPKRQRDTKTPDFYTSSIESVSTKRNRKEVGSIRLTASDTTEFNILHFEGNCLAPTNSTQSK